MKTFTEIVDEGLARNASVAADNVALVLDLRRKARDLWSNPEDVYLLDYLNIEPHPDWKTRYTIRSKKP